MAISPPKAPTFEASQTDTEVVLEGTPSIDLPAENKIKELEGSINLLGSSYSGTDIKVVVHLYGDIEKSKQLTDLELEAKIVAEVADAADNLANCTDHAMLIIVGGSTFGDPTDTLLGIAFPGVQPENRSLAVIVNNYSTIVSFGTSNAQKKTQLRASYQQIAGEYSNMKTQLSDKISRLSNVQNKSASTIVLATLQTLSVQSHREKHPVRALGSSYVRNYTRGPRTIAGSMIFTMFNEHSLAQLIRSMGNAKLYGEGKDNEISSLLIDQLPPVDVTIVFANEYGSLSSMSIYGVEFLNNGMTMSIEDILTEEVVNFVARDMDPMVSRGNIALDRASRGMHFQDGNRDDTGTSLLIANKDTYVEYLDKLKVRRRLLNR